VQGILTAFPSQGVTDGQTKASPVATNGAS
jgi:hypothetical protein